MDIIKGVKKDIAFRRMLEKTCTEQPDMSLKDFIASLPEKGEELAPSPSLIVLQLYGLIVFPWEKWKRDLKRKNELKKIDPFEWGRFRILNLPRKMAGKKIRLDFVLEKLRNAIAHAQIGYREKDGFIFRDKDGTALCFDKEELRRFTESLAAFG